MLDFLRKPSTEKHQVEIKHLPPIPEIAATLQLHGLPVPLAQLIQKFTNKNYSWLGVGTPWITEGSYAWLDVNLRPTDRVIEYGGGRSTLWWATKAECVTCVEASPEWAVSVLLYAYTRPELMKKLRMYFCPSEWNPSFDSGLKEYWRANRGSITHQDMQIMERDFLIPDFHNHNVVLFDGSIRTSTMTHKLSTWDMSKVDIVVFDNTEGPVVSHMADALMPENFERLDFAAGPKDDIPSHQRGKHVTSIFVRNGREWKETPSAHPIRMTAESRSKHMHESTENAESGKRRVAQVRKYLKTLGL